MEKLLKWMAVKWMAEYGTQLTVEVVPAGHIKISLHCWNRRFSPAITMERQIGLVLSERRISLEVVGAVDYPVLSDTVQSMVEEIDKEQHASNQ